LFFLYILKFYFRKIEDEQQSIIVVEEPPHANLANHEIVAIVDEVEMCLEDSQSTANFNSSIATDLDSLEDMDIEEELIENFVDSFTTPLYMLPPSHQVYTAPISQYHHYMAMCAFSSYHSLS